MRLSRIVYLGADTCFSTECFFKGVISRLYFHSFIEKNENTRIMQNYSYNFPLFRICLGVRLNCYWLLESFIRVAYFFYGSIYFLFFAANKVIT